MNVLGGLRYTHLDFNFGYYSSHNIKQNTYGGFTFKNKEK